MQRLLGKRGVRFLTGGKVLTETYNTDQEGIQIDVQLGDDKQETLRAEKMLVSVGRQAMSKILDSKIQISNWSEDSLL